MSGTTPARDRPSLPNMERLLMLWEARDTPATALEHAVMAFHALWQDYLAEMDATAICEWLESDQPRDVDEVAGRIAHHIDDELTWALGNRPETANVLEDDEKEHTFGELIAVITVLSVLLDRWPHEVGECPHAPTFVQTSRAYDHLVTGLLTGDRRQPRRRAHGAPPIPRPHPIATQVKPR
ncbi:hypothetical protein [Nocardia sp. NPDC005366]|uniref:hypothetical protein n=1 Tax=Nocardia sp. NPDC005366 TaxID=3156878 RepID=UPI0033A22D38